MVVRVADTPSKTAIPPHSLPPRESGTRYLWGKPSTCVAWARLLAERWDRDFPPATLKHGISSPHCQKPDQHPRRINRPGPGHSSPRSPWPLGWYRADSCRGDSGGSAARAMYAGEENMISQSLGGRAEPAISQSPGVAPRSGRGHEFASKWPGPCCGPYRHV